jgi:cell division septal protein FtsQ
MKKRRKKSRIVLGALCTLAVLVFSFFAITHVTDGNATVTGNVWVREDEIRKLVFDGGFWSRNSLYLCKVRKTVVPEKSALIHSIDIEYAGINKVVLRVNENSPIGYVEVGDKDYYFDLKGVVLEVRKTDSPMVIVNEEEELAAAVASTSDTPVTVEDAAVYKDMTPTLVDLDDDGMPETDANGIWLADSDGDGKPDVTAGGVALVDINGDGTPDVTLEEVEEARRQKQEEAEAEEQRQKEEAEKASAERKNSRKEELTAQSVDSDGNAVEGKTYEQALAELPLVTGLTDQKLKKGSKIEVKNKKIFYYIQALKKVINKFGIRPDYISVENGTDISLHCGDIVVNLGSDNLLEDKISRMSSIFPQLDGMKGTLHLETYTDETVNIVFEKEEAKIARYKKKNNIVDKPKKDSTEGGGENSGENSGEAETGGWDAQGGDAGASDGQNVETWTEDGTGGDQSWESDTWDDGSGQNTVDTGQQSSDFYPEGDGTGGLVIVEEG